MGSLVLAGATSGSTTITPTDAVTATVTLPSTGGTLQTSGAGFTTNGVAYATSTSALATGSTLTWSGSALAVTGTINTSVGATTTNALSINATTAGYGSVVTYQTGGVTKYTAGLNVVTGTGEWGIYDNSAATTRFYLNSSGNLGLGTTNPDAKLKIVVSPASGALTITDNTSSDFLVTPAVSSGVCRVGPSAGAMAFYANNLEAARIDSSQHLLLGNTAPAVAVAEYKMYLQGPANAANSNSTALADQKCGLYLYDSHAGDSNTEGAQNALVIAVSQGGASTPGNLITGYTTYSTPSRTFQVTAYGAVYNNNGTYGTLSDQKAKQDIVDASSQWQDIKNVRVRKYRLKSEVERNENAPSLIGVVAQELELTSPNLVDSPKGCETDENVFKTVKTSVLQMKALKALQEAMARIETLETTITSLTERITALEGK